MSLLNSEYLYNWYVFFKTLRKIPVRIESDSKAALEKNDIPAGQHGYFIKWLCYYLDFCEKYSNDPHDHQSLPHFIDKLKKSGRVRPSRNKPENPYVFFLHLYPSENKSAKQKTGSF